MRILYRLLLALGLTVMPAVSAVAQQHGAPTSISIRLSDDVPVAARRRIEMFVTDTDSVPSDHTAVLNPRPIKAASPLVFATDAHGNTLLAGYIEADSLVLDASTTALVSVRTAYDRGVTRAQMPEPTHSQSRLLNERIRALPGFYDIVREIQSGLEMGRSYLDTKDAQPRLAELRTAILDAVPPGTVLLGPNIRPPEIPRENGPGGPLDLGLNRLVEVRLSRTLPLPALGYLVHAQTTLDTIPIAWTMHLRVPISDRRPVVALTNVQGDTMLLAAIQDDGTLIDEWSTAAVLSGAPADTEATRLRPLAHAIVIAIQHGVPPGNSASDRSRSTATLPPRCEISDMHTCRSPARTSRATTERSVP